MNLFKKKPKVVLPPNRCPELKARLKAARKGTLVHSSLGDPIVVEGKIVGHGKGKTFRYPGIKIESEHSTMFRMQSTRKSYRRKAVLERRAA